MNLKNKKITFLTSSLTGGGAEGVCVNIANRLADRGWDITVVVLNTDRSVYHEKLSKKVNFVILNVGKARYSLKALHNYIKNNEVDKIVVFNYVLTVILILIRMITRLKFCLIARNINSLTEKLKHSEKSWHSKFLFGLILTLYKKSDFIVNQCVGMQDNLLSIFPTLKNKVTVIYNPVAQEVENFANNLVVDDVEKQNYILCVGRLEKQKAFHLAIKAFSSITNDHPKLCLKIVGEGSLKRELENLAKDLNVDGRVDFEGFQKNIIPYYLHAKVILLTSLYEGFPNTLIESITLGTPVVSFDCKSGPKEIVEPENGLLIEFQNERMLNDALNQVLMKPLDAVKVANTAKKFNSDNIIEQWESLLYKLE